MTGISARIGALAAQGHGDRHIARECGITRHRAREELKKLEVVRAGRSQRAVAVVQPSGTILEVYDAACRALDEARQIQDVLPLLDQVDHVKLHAKKIRDRQLMADALAFQQVAERRLGQIITAARAEGHFLQGHRPKSPDQELLGRATLADVGVDRKLSAHAQKLAALGDEEFERANETLRERVIAGAAKIVDREAAAQEKQTRRESRERILGIAQQAMPQQKFGVILADPEWRFEPWSRESGMDRAADNHYPTSCTEVIAARDVPSIAADDCVLFLWATVPMLPQALLVMSTWGFDYRSQFVWVKDRIGTGYWTRNQHELLLIGVRGNPPAPAPGTRESSVIQAPAAEHSAKPEIILDYVDGWYPTLPKIELNRRGPPRPGWQAWGYEAEEPQREAAR